ncbi:MAG: HAMP domain-containing histidine kinase, partial [Oscillospiraceae bacterium]|nr:HAMP domain-containing histidine kinase [Oscillospiraceae bacterium]
HGTWRMPWEVISPALMGNFTQVGNAGGLFDQSMLIAAQPFTLQGETAGFVLAAQPFSAGLFEYLGGILRLFLLSALVISVLVFAAVFLITRRLIKPLNAMIAATKRFAQGDFRHRVTSPDNDELRLLANAFNAMAINLATLEASRRSFVANVSHELKTPMTSIGGFIDGMLDGTIPPESHEKYLALVSGEVRRLSRLVTGMLNLSRIEAGQLQMQRSTFDLSELLFTTLLSFEKMIAEKHLELGGLDDLQPLTIIGDQDLLTQVFYNLIDNAVKFTPPGGEITLHLQQTPTSNRITLRNTGGGLTPNELDRIFERFYKADQSRSYDTRGAGLGLYLVQTIVRMHGGDITVDSDHKSWVEFAVELPLD